MRRAFFLLFLIFPTLAFAVSNPPSQAAQGYYRPAVFSCGTAQTVWRATGSLTGSGTTQDSIYSTGTTTKVTDVLIPTSVDLRRQATPVISATCSQPSLMTRVDGSDLWQLSGTFSGTQVVTITYSSSTQTIAQAVTVTGTSAAVSQFSSYVAGSLARHITDSMTTLMASKSLANNGPLYTSRNSNQGSMASTTWVRSGSCWLTSATGVTARAAAADADGFRTGSLGITAISSRHVLMANHARLWPGQTVYFVTASGSTITRTISAVSPAIYSDGRSYDLCVGKLDSDLPSTIAYLPVMPSGWVASKAPGIANGIPIVQVGDLNQTTPVQSIISDGTYADVYKYVTHNTRTDDWRHAAVIGDSGTPLCAIINNRLVLLGLEGTGAASLSQLTGEINAAMTALGGSYQLTTVSLSGFTSY
jgi:hypothetical protein